MTGLLQMADAGTAKRARVIPAVEPGPNTVGAIFRAYGEEWRAGRVLSYRQRQAFDAICACRTAAMGTRADVCEQCGTIRLSYGSCGDRHCPQCQSLARHRWLTAREAELLPIAYFHSVFTLPHEYNELVPYNEELMYDLLFRASAAMLLKSGRQELGATLGLTGLLHTWEQRLQRHIHVHYIVTGACAWASCRSPGARPDCSTSPPAHRSPRMRTLPDNAHPTTLPPHPAGPGTPWDHENTPGPAQPRPATARSTPFTRQINTPTSPRHACPTSCRAIEDSIGRGYFSP